MNNKDKKINLLKTMVESIENINLYIEAIVNKLYEGDDKIAFEGLAFISEELTWIFKGLELTNDIVNMGSLNNNILNYEISPLLNDLINLIEESIK